MNLKLAELSAVLAQRTYNEPLYFSPASPEQCAADAVRLMKIAARNSTAHSNAMCLPPRMGANHIISETAVCEIESRAILSPYGLKAEVSASGITVKGENAEVKL